MKVRHTESVPSQLSTTPRNNPQENFYLLAPAQRWRSRRRRWKKRRWGSLSEAFLLPEHQCRTTMRQSKVFPSESKHRINILGSGFPSVWECWTACPPLLISPKCRVLCVLFPVTPVGSRGAASQTWESEMRWLFILPATLWGPHTFLFFSLLLSSFPSSSFFFSFSFFSFKWRWSAA